jgi:F-type H+-transporting ATPase subunit b
MEALGKLGIDFKVLIAQFINFGILFFLLKYLLYKPILNTLNERRLKIKASLEMAEDVKKKHALAEQQYEEMISQANTKADAMILEAKEKAESIRKELIGKAENEAAAVLEDAQNKLNQAREDLYAEVRQSAGRLAVTLMTKVLKQDLDEEFCRKSVDKALIEIEAKI